MNPITQSNLTVTDKVPLIISQHRGNKSYLATAVVGGRLDHLARFSNGGISSDTSTGFINHFRFEVLKPEDGEEYRGDLWQYTNRC